MTGPTPADLDALLPHAGGMRLVERVLEVREDALRCVARVGSGAPVGAAGGAPALLGVEMAAQAAALHEALAGGGPDRPVGARRGYLVGVRDLRLAVRRLPVDRDLRVSVRRRGQAPPLAIYAATVDLDGETLVEGTIRTYAGASPAPGAGHSSAKQNH